MRNYIKLGCLISLFLLAHALMAQKNRQFPNHVLRIEVEDYEDTTLLLNQIYGDEVLTLDTIHQNRTDTFIYNIPYGTPKGVYRIIIDKEANHSIDIVYNREDIAVKTHSANPREELQILKSLETRLYHRYQRAEGYIRYKENVIDQMLQKFPAADPFYKEIEKKYIHLQRERYDSSEIIVNAHPETFMADIIKMNMIPVKNVSRRAEWQVYQKRHFFDHTEFSDASLLRSQAIPNKILDFLSLYRNSGFTKAQQQKEFSKAVDTLIKYTQVNPEVFDFTINFLIDGFKRYEFNQLVAHIANQTEAALKCINRERRDALKEKIKKARLAAPGTKAPGVNLPGLQGDTVSLSSLDKPQILVVFWASWCPHCMKMLPELQKLYSRYSDNLEIYAISLDTDKQEWQNVAKNYSWIHVSDLKGWDSVPVEKYQVFGTPSFFLLGDNREIKVRSGSISAIKNYLNKKPQD